MITNSIPPTQLLVLLEQVIREAPPLVYQEALTESDLRWLARAEALVEAAGTITDLLDFRMSRKAFGTINQDRNGVMSPLLKCYYSAELLAPPEGQGHFIPPGDTWGGYAAVVRLVDRPCAELLIVDPYLDASIFTDILPHARATKSIRCLTVKTQDHAALFATASRWAKDRGEHPVELRYAQKKLLHDRLIFLDDEAWDISQSLKDLAHRSPASLTRSDPEMGRLKLDHYASLWESSTAIS